MCQLTIHPLLTKTTKTMPKRYLFTSHNDLRELKQFIMLFSRLSRVIGSSDYHLHPPVRSNEGEMRPLDKDNTYFLITHDRYAFEIKRDEKHGAEGLEELACWLAFRFKGDISRAT
jgi:hypothetical protein